MFIKLIHFNFVLFASCLQFENLYSQRAAPTHLQLLSAMFLDHDELTPPES